MNVYDEDEDEEEGDPAAGAIEVGEGRIAGPDERDADLMDGTWEQQYYTGGRRERDWGTISAGIAVLLLVALLVPLVLAVTP